MPIADDFYKATAIEFGVVEKHDHGRTSLVKVKELLIRREVIRRNLKEGIAITREHEEKENGILMEERY